jgi:hypothetical protein
MLRDEGRPEIVCCKRGRDGKSLKYNSLGSREVVFRNGSKVTLQQKYVTEKQSRIAGTASFLYVNILLFALCSYVHSLQASYARLQ